MSAEHLAQFERQARVCRKAIDGPMQTILAYVAQMERSPDERALAEAAHSVLDALISGLNEAELAQRRAGVTR